jgi:hypothetical protein
MNGLTEEWWSGNTDSSVLPNYVNSIYITFKLAGYGYNSRQKRASRQRFVGLAIDKCFGLVDIYVSELEMDITGYRNEHRASVSWGSFVVWVVFVTLRKLYPRT